MNNLYGVLFLLLAAILVIAFWAGILWLYRRANGRHLRDGADAIASVHTSDVLDIRVLDGESTHSEGSTFHEGGGEFGGAGASESYDSGGGDSGDSGGDGGGDGGGD